MLHLIAAHGSSYNFLPFNLIGLLIGMYTSDFYHKNEEYSESFKISEANLDLYFNCLNRINSHRTKNKQDPDKCSLAHINKYLY
jgi:hypothetical protein